MGRVCFRFRVPDSNQHIPRCAPRTVPAGLHRALVRGGCGISGTGTGTALASHFILLSMTIILTMVPRRRQTTVYHDRFPNRKQSRDPPNDGDSDNGASCCSEDGAAACWQGRAASATHQILILFPLTIRPNLELGRETRNGGWNRGRDIEVPLGMRCVRIFASQKNRS